MAEKIEPSIIFGDIIFHNIFRSFKIAIHPKNIIIAFFAVSLIWASGLIMDFTSKSVVTSSSTVNELTVYLNNPASLKSYISRFDETGSKQGVFKTINAFAFKKLHMAINNFLTFNFAKSVNEIIQYFKAISWLFKYHMFYCVIFFVIKLVIISITGGALCRRSALKFSQDQQIGIFESLFFSLKRFKVFITAPLTPVAIILCLGFIIIFLFSLLLNIPYAGEMLILPFLPIQMLAGGIMTYLVVGAIAGFALMFPSIAYDRADSFDAMNRSLGYIYGKPSVLAFYVVISSIYGALCYMFVRLFAFLMVLLTRSFSQIAIFTENHTDTANKLDALWPEPTFMNLLGTSIVQDRIWSEKLAAFGIKTLILFVSGVVISFALSYFFSASTVIYALMRKQVDNTDLQEIYIDQDNSEHIELTASEQSNDSEETNSQNTENNPENIEN